jgi:hypothetical protein
MTIPASQQHPRGQCMLPPTCALVMRTLGASDMGGIAPARCNCGPFVAMALPVGQWQAGREV